MVPLTVVLVCLLTLLCQRCELFVVVVQVGNGLRDEDSKLLDSLQALRFLMLGHCIYVDRAYALVLLEDLLGSLGQEGPELSLQLGPRVLHEDRELERLHDEVVLGQLLDVGIQMVPSLPDKVGLHVALQIQMRPYADHLRWFVSAARLG